jgi:hypothetical protein
VGDSADGYGTILRTTDSGNTWVRQGSTQTIPNVHLNAVSAVDDQTAWAALGSGPDDVCAASTDDAWGVQNGDGVSGFIWRVHVAADGTPEAKNVTPPELGGYMPGGVTCLDTSVAWVVADKGIPPDPTKPLGIILHTTDGG